MHFATYVKKLMQGLAMLGVLVCWLGATFTAAASSVVVGPGAGLSWTAPSDLSDIAEYWVYLYELSGDYDLTQTPSGKVPVGTDEWSIVIDEGKHHAIVTAADEAGNQSPPSNEISFVWDSTAPPEGPTQLRVIIRQAADGSLSVEVERLACEEVPIVKAMAEHVRRAKHGRDISVPINK